MKNLLLCLIATAAFAQQELTLTAPAPAFTGSVTATATAPGNGTYYYWVVATFPRGNASPAGPAEVKADPSGAAPVTVWWAGQPGATSYAVLRTSTPYFPASGTCTCLVAAGLTVTSRQDTGAALGSYTINSVTAPVQATVRLNNQDYAQPRIVITQPLSDLTVRGNADFSSASTSKPYPVYAADPAGCLAGQVYRNSATGKFRKCYSAGLWGDEITADSGGSFSSGATCPAGVAGAGCAAYFFANHTCSDYAGGTAGGGCAIATASSPTQSYLITNWKYVVGAVPPDRYARDGGSTLVIFGISTDLVDGTYPGDVIIYTAPSGVAGDAITWTEKFRLTQSGGITITGSLSVTGTALLGNGPIEQWRKYSLSVLSNGVGGCANANGCWAINGAYMQDKAAGLNDDYIKLFTLPARGAVLQAFAKTVTPCSGPGVATVNSKGIGNASSNPWAYTGLQTYDLSVAASDTNLLYPLAAAVGSPSFAATSVITSIRTTGANVDQLTACSVDYWVRWGILP